MMRSTFIAAVMAISSPALADSRPTGLPDFSIEKSCAMFAAHPRPLALCQDEETYYRGQIKESRTVGIFFNFRIGLRDDAMAAAVVSEDVTIRIVDDQANVQPSRPPKRAKVRSKKVARATHRLMGYPVVFY